MIPFKVSKISSSVFPHRFSIYSISTDPFSESDTARASPAVSTLDTALCGLIVLFVKISAFLISFLSESVISSDDMRG